MQELKNDGEHSEDRPQVCSRPGPGPGTGPGTGLLAIIQVSPVSNIILLLLEGSYRSQVCDSFPLVQKYGYVKSLKPNN